MRRVTAGRDVQLSVRMAVVLVLLGAGYAAIAAALAALYRLEPSWWPWITIFAVLIGGFAVAHVVQAGDVLLKSVGVDLEGHTPQAEELRPRLERLAALAELPTPRLGVVDSDDANAFTVGVRDKHAVIVMTTGLLDRLDANETDAVLAHELAHLANRDGAVMTLASVPATIGRTLTNAEAGNEFFLWFFLWPLGLLPLAYGTLLTLALSRYREFAADRGSALLTGRPETMMSALVKLDAAGIPDGDLRTVGALCVAGARHGHQLLMDHPPLAERLAKLAALDRQLGTAVA